MRSEDMSSEGQRTGSEHAVIVELLEVPASSEQVSTPWNRAYLRLFIPSNMGSYPHGLPCRAQATKSSLVMTRTSRPYEMGILCEEYLIRVYF